MTTRITDRQVVHGLISEYRKQPDRYRKHQLRAVVRVLAQHKLPEAGHEWPGAIDT